ncbi:hypothetical protein ACE6H2_010031 [Prunus campanulata]
MREEEIAGLKDRRRGRNRRAEGGAVERERDLRLRRVELEREREVRRVELEKERGEAPLKNEEKKIEAPLGLLGQKRREGFRLSERERD